MLGNKTGCRLILEQALHRCLVTCEGLLVSVRIREKCELVSFGALLYFWPVVDAEFTRTGAIRRSSVESDSDATPIDGPQSVRYVVLNVSSVEESGYALLDVCRVHRPQVFVFKGSLRHEHFDVLRFDLVDSTRTGPTTYATDGSYGRFSNVFQTLMTSSVSVGWRTIRTSSSSASDPERSDPRRIALSAIVCIASPSLLCCFTVSSVCSDRPSAFSGNAVNR